MALSNTCTLEQDPPRRPALDDLGNGLWENDATYTPDPGHPDARAFNQSDKLVIAALTMAWVVCVRVTFTAGTPALSIVACVRADVVAGDFTLVDNGVGDVTVTPPADVFPGKTFNPQANRIQSTARAIDCIPVTGGGAQVLLFNSAGAAVDSNFELFFSGV